jgi:hypothetical protein
VVILVYYGGKGGGIVCCGILIREGGSVLVCARFRCFVIGGSDGLVFCFLSDSFVSFQTGLAYRRQVIEALA